MEPITNGDIALTVIASLIAYSYTWIISMSVLNDRRRYRYLWPIVLSSIAGMSVNVLSFGVVVVMLLLFTLLASILSYYYNRKRSTRE